MTLERKRKAEDTVSTAADRVDMYELALSAAERAVDAQRDELSGMRTRSVQFSALTVTGAAFLVGAGLKAPERVDAFYPIAIIATGFFGLQLLALLLMTAPMFGFRFVLDPAVLFEWIEGKTPAASKAILQRQLASHTFPSMVEDNEKSLRRIRVFYRLVLLFGSLSLGFWIGLIWAFA